MSTFSQAERRALLPIFLIVVVDILGLTIILPLLPFYAEEFGASPRQIGLLIATYAVCQLISGPLLGQLADRMGRKPLLLVSQAGTLLGFFVLGRATSLSMVFVSRAIDGMTAGNLSLAQAYVSDVTARENRAKAFGVIGIAFGIGFLIGPAISGYLSQYGHRYPIYAAEGLSALSILATALLLPSARPHAPGDAAEPAGRRLALLSWGRYREYFTRPELASLLYQFFAFAFSFATFTSGFALFAERQLTWDGHPFGAKHVGYVFAYAGFLGIILQGGLIGRLVKRFGEAKLARAGFATMAAGYGLLGLVRHVPSLLGCATLSSFGQGALRPALTAQVTHNSGRDEQGLVLGITQSLMSVAQITAPPLTGFLIGHQLLFVWALMAGLAAVVGLLLNLRQPVLEAR
ncbi:MAG TPA: MFS transporter [Polyangiaceae bacterium]|nr:MFS transporter [Polyangiaceae bacterium]